MAAEIPPDVSSERKLEVRARRGAGGIFSPIPKSGSREPQDRLRIPTKPATEIGDPIAVRELEARAADGSVRPILVRFGRPERDPLPGGDWRCPFQIVGIGDDAVQFAFGVDAVQALQLAFVAAGARLFAAQGPQRSITWLDMPELGFPEPPES